MKHKLVHIHTDFKFLYETLRYKEDSFYNEIFFIGDVDEMTINKLENLNFPYRIYSFSEIDKIQETISEFDGIVFYSLDVIKIDILTKIDKNKKVFLRLFGYELYSQKLNKYISKNTLNLINPITFSNKDFRKNLKKIIKRILGFEYRVNQEKQKALYSKIDAVLLVNKFEYEELSKYFYLPRFIQVSLIKESPIKLDISTKNNSIIVGNSRNFWNNHLDVLKLIQKSKRFINYKFIVFFNYGDNNNYAQAVRKKADKNSFVFIENFLDINEFTEIYNCAAGLVVNSYRQHALGNIYSALLSGTKVYLNKKSSTFHSLKHDGFIISEVNELPKDLDCDNVKLTLEEYSHNVNCYNQVKNNYTNVSFIENIITVLKHE